MVSPVVLARMKKRGDLVSLRIAANQIRAFVEIATVARKRQVFWRIVSAMLAGQ